MTSPHTLLKAWNLRASKQLGQNFLTHTAVAEMIVSRARLTPKDIVVEIGAGLGALTIPIARQVRKVYAVEKDPRLIELLRTEIQVAGLSNVEILPQDFLRMDLAHLARENAQTMIVCGNLPYNISSQILVRLIEAREMISRAILMFQKELAERLMARPGVKAYGRITAMLQYCADLKSVAHLDAANFHPAPKVASQVLNIEFKTLPDYPEHDERFLFRVIKAAFGNRRKTLKNSLTAGGLGIKPQLAQKALGQAGIDYDRRAETLSPAEFVDLAVSLDILIRSNDNPA